MIVRLVKTCEAYPEQYDAYLGERQVGYLRLRGGAFRVRCPDHGGVEVYAASPQGDGSFDDEERDYFLRFAVDAILRWARDPDSFKDRPPPPDVAYVVA